MGRGKLNMELICNEKSQMITYHKIKTGLTKKAREFQILCGVDLCVIIFGPNLNNHMVTWSRNPHTKTLIPGKPIKLGLIGV